MSFTAGAGTRYVVISTTNPSGGSTVSGPFTITGGTATTNTPVLDATQTWNNAAVTFTGFRFNITDTASNASSLLMDLQVGGTPQYQVGKRGQILFRSRFGTAGQGTGAFFDWINAGGIVAGYGNGNGAWAFGGADVGSWTAISVSSWDGAGIGFGSGASVTYQSTQSGNIYNVNINTGSDLFIGRDAANTLAQRNGVNAQTFRLYNTFTDASNYERGYARWSGNVFEIGAEGAGTGANRNVRIRSNSGVIELNDGNSGWSITSGAMRIGTRTIEQLTNIIAQSGYTEIVEMTAPAAPAANSVRIYAEDNGAGKTRLMARFATGAAVQIAIEP